MRPPIPQGQQQQQSPHQFLIQTLEASGRAIASSTSF
ncbi:hypothetical protein SLEP1_g21506 [Rubroshorea leprosula]|uniref:Uncharacterized protein n=1 Tax=Rubroshorea leprosula TaxID=152421 RepID=A0AAV5JFB3_9ROSI|nr:hypothetical protein SLEP1_g21506 [Rubroshorea leprosula]